MDIAHNFSDFFLSPFLHNVSSPSINVFIPWKRYELVNRHWWCIYYIHHTSHDLETWSEARTRCDDDIGRFCYILFGRCNCNDYWECSNVLSPARDIVGRWSCNDSPACHESYVDGCFISPLPCFNKPESRCR